MFFDTKSASTPCATPLSAEERDRVDAGARRHRQNRDSRPRRHSARRHPSGERGHSERAAGHREDHAGDRVRLSRRARLRRTGRHRHVRGLVGETGPRCGAVWVGLASPAGAGPPEDHLHDPARFPAGGSGAGQPAPDRRESDGREAHLCRRPGGGWHATATGMRGNSSISWSRRFTGSV